jgi:hypothetical protein
MTDLRLGEFRPNKESFDPLDVLKKVIEVENQSGFVSVTIKDQETFPKLVIGEMKRFQYIARKLISNALFRSRLSGFLVAA